MNKLIVITIALATIGVAARTINKYVDVEIEFID